MKFVRTALLGAAGLVAMSLSAQAASSTDHRHSGVQAAHVD